MRLQNVRKTNLELSKSNPIVYFTQDESSGAKSMRDDMPTSDELEETLLLVFSKSKKLLRNDEMLVAVSNYLFLSPKLHEIRRNDGRSELKYRMAWARTHAKEKGLIINKGKSIWGLAK